MEDTLGVNDLRVMGGGLRCLNPYSNGRYSRSTMKTNIAIFRNRLNPYSNGRYSRSRRCFR